MKITKQKLEKLYIQEKQTVKQIGKFFNISIATVSRTLKKFNIRTRPFTEKGRTSWNKGISMRPESKEKLRKAHIGKSLSPEHREKVLKTLTYGKVGEANHMWKGGKYISPKGYIYLRIPNHPFLQSNGYYAEHRFVMEQKLGRYLTQWEHIHHINRDKHDNRIENLELVNAHTHNLITMLENRVKELEAENEMLKNSLICDRKIRKH